MNDTLPIEKVTRKGSGRTKGSFSFVTMTLDEARTLNPNPNYKFMFKRTQIESLGGNNLVTAKVSELEESLAGQSAETVPVVKSEEF
jgi:hypothetical protein